MKIIGVGCGPGLISELAIKELKKARIVYGSERAIELARPYLTSTCSVKSIDDFKTLSRLPKESTILSTGDPMLAGLGYLPGEVIPGISSLQVASARLHIPLARISVVVAHGRGHEKGMADTLAEVKRGKIVFLLADPKFDVDELYSRLLGLGEPLQIAVCENLGYPDERIIVGNVQSPPRTSAALYSLMIGEF
ncbi:cobalt-precorrin-7 (C(5))-methyltransferase [uncultured Methanoregula sp.]|uniref:cobalt-precorrin-7 (C(5))-methyltransferase n=1 Tax=uncultured Methanoregula sp. TaxID=1005933 RepID=UPI002AABD866|nr:cobalt-precorrin-7 (C(5))-methyltransferase [uncultured Methanoregula sp.]